MTEFVVDEQAKVPEDRLVELLKLASHFKMVHTSVKIVDKMCEVSEPSAFSMSTLSFGVIKGEELDISKLMRMLKRNPAITKLDMPEFINIGMEVLSKADSATQKIFFEQACDKSMRVELFSNSFKDASNANNVRAAMG